MALGKTILASDFKEIREVVSDREAILLSCNQPQQWIKAIQNLTREKAQDLGYHAQKVFYAHFTRKKRYKKLLDIIALCMKN